MLDTMNQNRNVNIKCDFCPHSQLTAEGKLVCYKSYCVLSFEDIETMMKYIFGE